MWGIQSILNLCFGSDDDELTPLSDIYIEHATSSSGNPPRILNVEHKIIFTISDPDDKEGKRLAFNDFKLFNFNALIKYFQETPPPKSFDINAVSSSEGCISSATGFIIRGDKANPKSWQEVLENPSDFSALHRYFHAKF